VKCFEKLEKVGRDEEKFGTILAEVDSDSLKDLKTLKALQELGSFLELQNIVGRKESYTKLCKD
jgi:hypothetical protein